MKRKAPPAEVLAQDYESGLSQKAIAEKYGLSPTTVQKHLLKAGVKSRNLSESHKLAYKTGRKEPKGPSGEKHWAWKGGKEARGYRGKVEKEQCAQCGNSEDLHV